MRKAHLISDLSHGGREEDAALPFVPIRWTQIQIRTEIKDNQGNMSMLLLNQATSSCLLPKAGKMDEK